MRNVPRDIAANNLGDQIGDGRVVAIVMDDWNVPFDDLDMIMNARAVGRYIVDTLGAVGRRRGDLPATGRARPRTSPTIGASCSPRSRSSSRRKCASSSRRPLGADRRRGRHAVPIEPDLDAQPVPAIAADHPDARHAGLAAGDDSEPPQDGLSGQHRHPAQSRRLPRLPGRARRHRCETCSVARSARTSTSTASIRRDTAATRTTSRIRSAAAAGRPSGSRPSGRASAAAKLRRDFLEITADYTGARAIVNDNDVSAEIDQIFDEAGTYYLARLPDVERQARRPIPQARDQSEPAGRNSPDPVRLLRAEGGHARRSRTRKACRRRAISA